MDPDPVPSIERFRQIDRFVACARASRPGDFHWIEPDERLVRFDTAPQNRKYLTVVGSRSASLDVDTIAWNDGRAHVLLVKSDDTALATGGPCYSSVRSTADLSRPIDHLDPKSVTIETGENAIGSFVLHSFQTRGRTQTCVHAHQRATVGTLPISLSAATLIATALWCRSRHSGVEDTLRADVRRALTSATLAR